MGRSAIAGWGLFAGEKVKAGQFLGVSAPITLLIAGIQGRDHRE